MQRWILIGVVVLGLVFSGGMFTYWQYRQNRAEPVWVPLPVNPELPLEQRDTMIKHLKTALSEKERLVNISRELSLPGKLQLKSDDAVAEELASRLFVKVGEFTTPKGTIPTVNIGVDGAHKEVKISLEIANRIMQDVWKILGITPPKPGAASGE
jgi:hypothetical protein